MKKLAELIAIGFEITIVLLLTLIYWAMPFKD